jgi:hypothetical protein
VTGCLIHRSRPTGPDVDSDAALADRVTTGDGADSGRRIRVGGGGSAGDCHNAEQLARFWSQVFGGLPVRRWTDARDREYVQLDDVRGGPALLFQPVDEAHGSENRIHLDIAPTGGRTQAEEVTRLVELGASIRSDEPELHWVVLADPAGNQFCLPLARPA